MDILLHDGENDGLEELPPLLLLHLTAAIHPYEHQVAFHFDRQRLQSAQIVVLIYKRRVRRQHAAVVPAILHDEARHVQLGFQLRERRVELSVSGKEGAYGQEGVRCEGRVQYGGPSVSVVEGVREHILLFDKPAARIHIVRELLPLSLLRVQLQA